LCLSNFSCHAAAQDKTPEACGGWPPCHVVEGATVKSVGLHPAFHNQNGLSGDWKCRSGTDAPSIMDVGEVPLRRNSDKPYFILPYVFPLTKCTANLNGALSTLYGPPACHVSGRVSCSR